METVLEAEQKTVHSLAKQLAMTGLPLSIQFSDMYSIRDLTLSLKNQQVPQKSQYFTQTSASFLQHSVETRQCKMKREAKYWSTSLLTTSENLLRHITCIQSQWRGDSSTSLPSSAPLISTVQQEQVMLIDTSCCCSPKAYLAQG